MTRLTIGMVAGKHPTDGAQYEKKSQRTSARTGVIWTKNTSSALLPTARTRASTEDGTHALGGLS